MAGRVAGKVAFITGAGRGQGRSHAIRLAEEGADIIAVDICRNYDTVGYGMSTEADLALSVTAAEALDRRIIATQADVRDYAGLKQALDDGVAQLGRLDIVCSNAGIASFGQAAELAETTWQDMIDIQLTGMWHACKAAIPHLIAGGRGGSIVITSRPAPAATQSRPSWIKIRGATRLERREAPIATKNTAADIGSRSTPVSSGSLPRTICRYSGIRKNMPPRQRNITAIVPRPARS